MRSLPLLLLLAGCAMQPLRTPSLAPRAVEGADFSEPVRAVPAAAPDPALDATIADAERAAAERETRFEAAAHVAQAQVARAAGQAAGSDPWLDAHVALGTLDGVRSEASEALSTLEQAAIDRGAAGGVPYPPLDAAVTRLRASADAMGERIAALQRPLAR